MLGWVYWSIAKQAWSWCWRPLCADGDGQAGGGRRGEGSRRLLHTRYPSSTRDVNYKWQRRISHTGVTIDSTADNTQSTTDACHDDVTTPTGNQQLPVWNANTEPSQTYDCLSGPSLAGSQCGLRGEPHARGRGRACPCPRERARRMTSGNCLGHRRRMREALERLVSPCVRVLPWEFTAIMFFMSSTSTCNSISALPKLACLIVVVVVVVVVVVSTSLPSWH